MNRIPRERRGRGTTPRAASTIAASGALLLLVLASTAGFGTPAAQAAATASPIPGLFGTQDPTYDGAYRQSEAILAFAALNETPPASAVTWLLDQQCGNGGWQAFRADTAKPCAASDAATYSGPDSNSTAMAVQALAAIGRGAQARKGLTFLASLQNADGGISNYADALSDANSTALAAAAARAVGGTLGRGPGASGALGALQIACEGATGAQGAYRFLLTDDPFANDYASAQAVLGAGGNWLPVHARQIDGNQAPFTCPGTTPSASERTSAGAWYLAQQLDAHNGTIPSAYTPGTTDWGSTRFAVISLASTGHGGSAIGRALAALAASQSSTIKDDTGHDRPGVLAELILANEAAHAPVIPASHDSVRAAARVHASASSATLDSTALLTRLNATLTRSPTTAKPSSTPTPTSSTTATDPNASTLPDTGADVAVRRSAAVGLLFLLIGAGLVALTTRRTTDRAKRAP